MKESGPDQMGGGFLGRIRDGWRDAGEAVNRPSAEEQEAAARQIRNDELQAVLDQQKPVEINQDRVLQNIQSFERMAKNLTPQQIRQATDFNNPEVAAAYELWSNRSKGQEAPATPELPDNVIQFPTQPIQETGEPDRDQQTLAD